MKTASRLALLALVSALAAPGSYLAQAADNAPLEGQAALGHSATDMYKPIKDSKRIVRDYVQQPPLIPHTINGYQITKNFNKCMDCHAFQRSKASGATKVSVTHFRTREGQELDNISPRRYFCTQCHVPQTDARPLVENTFTRARGLR